MSELDAFSCLSKAYLHASKGKEDIHTYIQHLTKVWEAKTAAKKRTAANNEAKPNDNA
jgi:hypothetical protein